MTHALLRFVSRRGSELRRSRGGARRPLGGARGLGPVHHHGPQGPHEPGLYPIFSRTTQCCCLLLPCYLLTHCASQLTGRGDGMQAQHLYLRNIHYLVRGGAAVIIDESTGRASLNSRWTDGIHQARRRKVPSALCHQMSARLSATHRRGNCRNPTALCEAMSSTKQSNTGVATPLIMSLMGNILTGGGGEGGPPRGAGLRNPGQHHLPVLLPLLYAPCRHDGEG